MKLDQAVMNKLVTEADNLYRMIEDGEAFEDVQEALDEVKDFLDNLVDVLEANGARVEGIEYLD